MRSLQRRVIRMVGRGRTEECTEEDGVLEAALDGLDEDRGEVPGVRAAVAEGFAFREEGTESWLELLEADDGAVVPGAVGGVDLLDSGKL